MIVYKQLTYWICDCGNYNALDSFNENICLRCKKTPDEETTIESESIVKGEIEEVVE